MKNEVNHVQHLPCSQLLWPVLEAPPTGRKQTKSESEQS